MAWDEQKLLQLLTLRILDLYDQDGIDVELLKMQKKWLVLRLSKYAAAHDLSAESSREEVWSIPVDIVSFHVQLQGKLPEDMLNSYAAKPDVTLQLQRIANMPTTLEASQNTLHGRYSLYCKL